MRVISFVATKGGVGKTTLSYQFGNYLAKEKNKKVLFMDFDPQRSLTSLYNIVEDKTTYNTGDILLGKKNIDILNVDKNIDMIPATVNLGNSILYEISLKSNKELLLFMWFIDNIKKLNYDYVIIDSNPAWNLISMNAVAASDLVLSPMEPSGFGYESHDKVLAGINELKKAVVNPVTKEEYVVADVYFIANLIKHNTATSKEFLEQIQKYNDILGVINEKEIINASMLEKKYVVDYVIEKGKSRTENKFLTQLKSVFDDIIKLENE